MSRRLYYRTPTSAAGGDISTFCPAVLPSPNFLLLRRSGTFQAVVFRYRRLLLVWSFILPLWQTRDITGWPRRRHGDTTRIWVSASWLAVLYAAGGGCCAAACVPVRRALLSAVPPYSPRLLPSPAVNQRYRLFCYGDGGRLALPGLLAFLLHRFGRLPACSFRLTLRFGLVRW